MEYVSSAVGAAKVRRAARWIQEDGKALLVAIDMQTASGAGPDRGVVEQIAAAGPDGMLVSWSIARRFPEAFRRVGLILRVDGSTTMLGNHAGGDGFAQLYGVEMAVTLGADAVVAMAFPGGDDETVGLRKLAALVNEAEKVGMPVVAESIPGSWARDVPWDAEHIAKAGRICVELGADAVKTMMPEDPAEIPDVVSAIDAPVFCLGGPRRESEDEAVAYAAAVVAAGVAGIAYGRNVLGAADPAGMVRRLHLAVHGGA